MMPAERVYELLLRAYPPALRAEFGRDMRQAFRDAWRDRHVSLSRFWLDIVRDIARVAAPHLAVSVAALLVLFSGVIVAASAVAETAADGLAGRGALSVTVLAAVGMASVLLLRCGVALWRRSDDSNRTVRRAAPICFALMAFIAVVDPVISGIARLLGLVVPLVLLLAMSRRRGGNPLTS